MPECLPRQQFQGNSNNFSTIKINDKYHYYGISHVAKDGKLLFLAYPIVALLGAVWIIHGVRQRIK